MPATFSPKISSDEAGMVTIERIPITDRSTRILEFAGNVTSPVVGTRPPHVDGECQLRRFWSRWGHLDLVELYTGVGGSGMTTSSLAVAAVMKGPHEMVMEEAEVLRERMGG